MSKMQTFVERCLIGSATPDEIDSYIDRWHDSDIGTEIPLHQFLGMSDQEYSLWLRDPNAIQAILQARRGSHHLDAS
jgi:hypothetical protein